MSARSRLYNRREHEVLDFEHEGFRYRVGIGRYGDGRLGEIFLDCVKGDTPLDVRARDDAVLLSMLLQHNCSIDAIRHAMMRRSDGRPLGLVGALLDFLAAKLAPAAEEAAFMSARDILEAAQINCRARGDAMSAGLQARVDAALAQARENGFDLFDLADPLLIACYLMDCDADFERENFDEVAACCLHWLRRREGRE